MNLTRLTKEIEAVCPIYGVSIGDESNKETWRIDFKPEATDGEHTLAIRALDAFDPDEVTPEDAFDAANSFMFSKGYGSKELFHLTALQIAHGGVSRTKLDAVWSWVLEIQSKIASAAVDFNDPPYSITELLQETDPE